MKPKMPEQFRITPEVGKKLCIPQMLHTDASFGRNGCFYIPHVKETLRVIVADQQGWEHVSISLPHRCPTWGEMCFIKDLFFEEDETAVQYHPAKSEYVNAHPFCLLIWRPIGWEFETPPAEMVGPRS